MELATRPRTRLRPWPWIKRALSWALMIAALAYIGWMLRGEGPALINAITGFRSEALVMALAAFVPMFILKALYHARILQQLARSPASTLSLASTYLQAQLVRYLPGKIWGVVYQSRRIKDSHDPGTVVTANLWQMLTTNLLSAGVVIGLLAAWKLSHWMIILVMVGIVAVEALHRMPWLRDRPLRWLAVRLPRLGINAPSRPATADKWIPTGILSAEWIFFLLGFVLLLNGLLSPAASIQLGAWYGVASILALAAFIVPAGLGVREAIFVSNASLIPGVDLPLLLVTATLLRLLMIAAEFLAVACMLLVSKFAHHDG